MSQLVVGLNPTPALVPVLVLGPVISDESETLCDLLDRADNGKTASTSNT